MELGERTTVGNRASPVARAYHDLAQLSAWPREPHGWSYLGKVVNQFGRAMFPEWRSYSAYGLLPDVLVGQDVSFSDEEPVDTTEAQIHYARWLVKERKDDIDYIFRADKPFAYLDYEDDGNELSDEEWNLACDMSQQEWAIGLANQRMFREVQAAIVEEAEAGRIVIGSRPVSGGRPKPTPIDWWFTDNYWARFAYLAIDPNDPFGRGKPSREVAHDMFVQVGTFEMILARLGGGAAQTLTSLNNHSPYMRLMLDVAEIMGISPAVQPNKESIMSELQSRWDSYGLPPSDNLVKSAASLLREPGSQAGRAQKQG